MSLEKSIKNGREHRKPYRKPKVYDKTCRNHGTCVWCRNNRTHSMRKRLLKAMTNKGENNV